MCWENAKKSEKGLEAFKKEITGINQAIGQVASITENFIFQPSATANTICKFYMKMKPGTSITGRNLQMYDCGLNMAVSFNKTSYNLGDTIGILLEAWVSALLNCK